MSFTKLAPSRPFEGKPRINWSGIYGASPKKPLIYRIPVLGKRPVTFTAENLPQGLTLNEKGIISGTVEEAENYDVTVTCTNELGSDTQTLTLEIENNHLALTPVLGFGSWNSFNDKVTQEDMMRTARIFDEEGYAEYGYAYMNIDSTWQGYIGGPHMAVVPNSKFPDMKGYCDYCHELGFKAGIYSSPYKWCWGGSGLPGCTCGETDPKVLNLNGGVGSDHREQNNVDQWDEWGFDYLKYDWNFVDIPTCEIMRKCLLNAKRDYVYSLSVDCHYRDAAYWSKNSQLWRDGPDSSDEWDTLMALFSTCDKWSKFDSKGHFFDLDVLEVIKCRGIECRLTEDEQIFAYSFRAVFPAPILIGNRMEDLNEFARALLCNEEIIAVNQDRLCQPAVLFRAYREQNAADEGCRNVRVYKKPLYDGSYCLAVFNFGDTEDDFVLELGEQKTVRDLWAKEDLPASSTLTVHTVSHSAKVFRIR